MSRSDYLAEHFNGWLERYSPPRVMAERPDAAQQEADTLLRIVARHAPANGYAEWLEGVLRALTEGMTARTWPTGGEVSKACRDASRMTVAPKVAENGWTMDPAQVAAKRMSAGEAVGEDWLYGVNACEVISRGLVDRDTMERYRSAAFLTRRAFYSEGDAFEWEAWAKKRHEDAKVLWKARNERRQQRDLSGYMPDTRRSA
jgi:hypothetical protein